MPIEESLLQVAEYTGEGYMPLIDYADWRVAILRYIDELLPDRLDKMQRHDETDEVFVLLAGHCILFLGAGDAAVTGVVAQDLEPQRLYNVKRGCWHTHTLSTDAVVLIVENRNTALPNSPEIMLTADQRARVLELTDQLWNKGSTL